MLVKGVKSPKLKTNCLNSNWKFKMLSTGLRGKNFLLSLLHHVNFLQEIKLKELNMANGRLKSQLIKERLKEVY